MTRVVCFGELLLRLSPPGRERLFQTPALRTWFGGSEANVAVGLTHLGTPTTYVTRLPAGPIGDAALAQLRAEGVDVSAVLRGGARMGIYFVESGADLRPMRVVYDRAGSAFSEIQASDVPWAALLAGSAWLHLSGITPALGDGPARAAAAAARAAREAGVPVSVDLNYRPALWAGRDPRPLVRPLVEDAALVVGNPGAFAAMLGVAAPEHDAGALGAVAAAVHAALGCARVAITRRDARSASEHGWSAVLWEAAAARLHEGDAYRVRVEDRVGGGDSFAAGLIHALLAGREARDALAFATAASALKLTIPGDFNRVSAAEVEQVLADPRHRPDAR